MGGFSPAALPVAGVQLVTIPPPPPCQWTPHAKGPPPFERRNIARAIDFGGGGGGVGTRPRYLIVCLWRRLLASRHCSF